MNYDQPLHRDYGSHSLVVPRPEPRYQQVTTFIFLSDVTEEDGPTCIVPYEDGKDVPYTPLYVPFGSLAEAEVACTGPAGSLLVYRTDILHRGSDMTGAGRSRFSLLADFQVRGHHLGRQDGLAQAVARALGQVHAAVHGAPARPLRLPAARRPLLVAPRRSRAWRRATRASISSRMGQCRRPAARRVDRPEAAVEIRPVRPTCSRPVSASKTINEFVDSFGTESAETRGGPQRSRPPGRDRNLGQPRAPGPVHGRAARRRARQGRGDEPPVERDLDRAGRAPHTGGTPGG